jgi:hypothetical protein
VRDRDRRRADADALAHSHALQPDVAVAERVRAPDADADGQRDAHADGARVLVDDALGNGVGRADAAADSDDHGFARSVLVGVAERDANAVADFDGVGVGQRAPVAVVGGDVVADQFGDALPARVRFSVDDGCADALALRLRLPVDVVLCSEQRDVHSESARVADAVAHGIPLSVCERDFQSERERARVAVAVGEHDGEHDAERVPIGGDRVNNGVAARVSLGESLLDEHDISVRVGIAVAFRTAVEDAVVVALPFPLCVVDGVRFYLRFGLGDEGEFVDGDDERDDYWNVVSLSQCVLFSIVDAVPFIDVIADHFDFIYDVPYGNAITIEHVVELKFRLLLRD